MKKNLVKVAIAVGKNMLSHEETILFAAVCEADLSRDKIRQYMNRRGRAFGVYVGECSEVGPMTEAEANEILMTLGIVPNCQVPA